MKSGIYLGDCRDFLDKIPKDAFLISDPPYNQGYHYDAYKDKMKKDDYATMLRLIFGDRKSVIIHYPEEMMMLFGGGHDGKCGAGCVMDIQQQHSEATSSYRMVRLQA